MSATTEVRAAMAWLASEHSDAAVSVTDNGGRTATDAVEAPLADVVQWDDAGAGGKRRGAFRVSAETLVFERGDLISVGSLKATVDGARKDALGALWLVAYTVQE